MVKKTFFKKEGEVCLDLLWPLIDVVIRATRATYKASNRCAGKDV